MIVREKTGQKVKSSNDVFEILKSIYEAVNEEDKHKEIFYAFGFDAKNNLLYVDMVALGTINQCVPFVREILRLALVKNACSVIIAHNHPSNDVTPSAQDERFTQETRKGCEATGIRFLDHLIYGAHTFFSFADEGR